MKKDIQHGICRSRRSAGFSLIELVVVIAIILVIVATATPAMIQVVSSARMRGGMSSMAVFAQSVRTDAVRQNQTQSLWTVLSGSEYFVYKATAQDTAPGLSGSAGQMPVGKQVIYMGTPVGAGAPSTLDSATVFGSSTVTVRNGTMSFNSRGLPCYWSSGTCSTGNAFVWYFVWQPPFGSSRWAALSISPAGRIKTWYWDGATWSN